MEGGRERRRWGEAMSYDGKEEGTFGERMGHFAVLVPEAVAQLAAPRLLRQNASHGGPDNAIRHVDLVIKANKEVDVVNVPVKLGHDFRGAGTHDLLVPQLIEARDGFQAANLTIVIVPRQAVVSASLDIQRNEIHAETGAVLLKQMIGYLSSAALLLLMRLFLSPRWFVFSMVDLICG